MSEVSYALINVISCLHMYRQVYVCLYGFYCIRTALFARSVSSSICNMGPLKHVSFPPRHLSKVVNLCNGKMLCTGPKVKAARHFILAIHLGAEIGFLTSTENHSNTKK